MLLIDEAKIVAEADGLAARGATVNEVLAFLRGRLSLDAFGMLLFDLPREDLPPCRNCCRAWPAMRPSAISLVTRAFRF